MWIPRYESDSTGSVEIRRKKHLEESPRNPNAGIADANGIHGIIDWTRHNHHCRVSFRPLAFLVFECFPCPVVEGMHLRTDIGHYEAVFHCLRVPFLVGGRAHVPSVITGTGVVARVRAALDVGIRPEFVAASGFPFGFIAEEFPSHVVRCAVVFVE